MESQNKNNRKKKQTEKQHIAHMMLLRKAMAILEAMKGRVVEWA